MTLKALETITEGNNQTTVDTIQNDTNHTATRNKKKYTRAMVSIFSLRKSFPPLIHICPFLPRWLSIVASEIIIDNIVPLLSVRELLAFSSTCVCIFCFFHCYLITLRRSAHKRRKLYITLPTTRSTGGNLQLQHFVCLPNLSVKMDGESSIRISTQLLFSPGAPMTKVELAMMIVYSECPFP